MVYFPEYVDRKSYLRECNFLYFGKLQSYKTNKQEKGSTHNHVGYRYCFFVIEQTKLYYINGSENCN